MVLSRPDAAPPVVTPRGWPAVWPAAAPGAGVSPVAVGSSRGPLTPEPGVSAGQERSRSSAVGGRGGRSGDLSGSQSAVCQSSTSVSQSGRSVRPTFCRAARQSVSQLVWQTVRQSTCLSQSSLCQSEILRTQETEK